MEEINNYIKENDTDNVIVSSIDKIIYDIVDDDYDYESEYGNSETMVEALGKLNRAIKDSILYSINELKECIFDNATLKLYVKDDTKGIFVYGVIKLSNINVCNTLLISTMKFSVDNITSSDIVNGEIEIGTIKGGLGTGYEDIKVDGVLNGICTIDGVKQMCRLRFEKPSSEYTKVYLVLDDNSTLSTTGKSLNIEATGTLHHNHILY